jgi:hypothetical protein
MMENENSFKTSGDADEWGFSGDSAFQTIYLNNGRVIEGIIKKVTPSGIVFDVWLHILNTTNKRVSDDDLNNDIFLATTMLPWGLISFVADGGVEDEKRKKLITKLGWK